MYLQYEHMQYVVQFTSIHTPQSVPNICYDDMN